MHKSGKISLVVEGNIGVGKSTFLKMLTDYLDIYPIFEPSQRWQDVGGDNLLDLFYRDTPRWAYTFQSYAFVSRTVNQEESIRKAQESVLIAERSVFSDRYCFAKNIFEMGVINHLEWQLYKEWFAWLVYQYTVLPAGFIYLRTSPEVCYERMRRRSRSEEATVGLEYLNLLYQKHENWLINKIDLDDKIKDLPVLVLQCDLDFEHNINEQQKHVRQIVDFFNIQSAVKASRRSEILQKQM